MKSIIAGNRLLFLLTGFVGLLCAAALGVFALKLGGLVDLIGQDQNSLLYQLFVCVGIIACWFLFSLAYNALRAFYAYRVINQTKSGLYAGINRLRLSEYESKPNEYYLNIFTKKFDILHENYLVPKCSMVADAASAIVSISLIFWISWKLALSFIAVTLVTIVISQLPGVIMAKKTEVFSKKNAQYLKVINNHLRGFEQIKLLGLFPNFQHVYLDTDKEFESSRRGYYATSWSADSFGIFVSFLAQLFCFGVGVYFVIYGDLTIGMLIAAINLLNNVFNPVQSFVHSKNLMGTVSEIFDSFNELLTVPQESGAALNTCVEKIEYQDVAVTLPSGRNLVSGFNYRFEKGKRYAIVGESGSGKSTLMKLLMGYYDPGFFTGKVLINEARRETLLPADLFSRIAYIQRNDFFIPGTVEDNITLNRDCAAPVELYAQLKISTELRSQKIEEGARHQISQGEKQRIDMARFLINDYDVLIFDEPSTNLDPKTSELVFDYILGITDKIVIVITHEPSASLLSRFDSTFNIKNYQS
ncbi:ABC transporter ATP-binding protein [Arcanobacterium hippocoleae]